MKKIKILSNQKGGTHFALVIIVVSLLIATVGYAYTQTSEAKKLGKKPSLGIAEGAIAGKKLANKKQAKKVKFSAATYNVLSQRWDDKDKFRERWESTNIFFPGRKIEVLGVIGKATPDIIGIQEAINWNPDTNQKTRQAGDIASYMRSIGYSTHATQKGNADPIYWKTSVFTYGGWEGQRLIVDKSSGLQPRYLNMVRLRHTKTGKTVLVANYHFSQFYHDKGKNYINNQLDGIAESITIAKLRYPKDKVIFTGDFNGYGDDVIRRLNDHNISINTSTPRARSIDHVMVESGVGKRGFKTIPNKNASDHNLVISRLAL